MNTNSTIAEATSDGNFVIALIGHNRGHYIGCTAYRFKLSLAVLIGSKQRTDRATGWPVMYIDGCFKDVSSATPARQFDWDQPITVLETTVFWDADKRRVADSVTP